MENPLRVAVLDQARSFAQQTMRKSIIWTAEKLSSTGAKHDREPMKRLLAVSYTHLTLPTKRIV